MQRSLVYRLTTGLLWALLALGCGRSEPSLAVAPTLPMSFGGCAEQRPDGLCELSAARTLTLWTAEAGGGELHVYIDGKRVVVEARTVAGGPQVRVVVSPGARTLLVKRGAQQFTLALATTPALPALDAARAAWASGKLTEATDLATSHYGSPDGRLAAHALDLAARIAMQAGKAKEAVALFARTAAAADRAGLLRLEARAHVATAYVHEFLLFSPDAALAELDQVDQHLHVDAASAQYHRAFIAFVLGDARRSLDLCAQGRAAAERLNHVPVLLTSSALELLQFAELGRLEEARAIGKQLLAQVREPCDLADALTNVGWAELSSSVGDTALAQRLSAEAAELYGNACPDPRRRQNALINLALAEWRRGANDTASQHLAQAAEIGEPEGWVRAWLLELEARLLLDQGKGKSALAVFEQLARRAEESATVSSRFRAQLGRGEALLALGRLRAAVDAFEQAEVSLDEDARRVPLAEGRDVYAGERDRSAKLLIDVLLTLGKPAEALLAARRARARALRVLTWRSQLARIGPEGRRAFYDVLAEYQRVRVDLLSEEGAAWSLPLSELDGYRKKQQERRKRSEAALDRAYEGLRVATAFAPSPLSANEVLLAFHPLPTGWVVFLQSGGSVAHKRLSALPPLDDTKALADALLVPFAGEIAAAERLRVLHYGALKQVDFHTLPFQQSMLLDALPVVYGNDLALPSGAPQGDGERLLIAADPRRDLPNALAEGRLLNARLRDQLSVQFLVGSQASNAKVLEALPNADAFHFAGHAEFAGNGWQSGLKLTSGTLEPGDILALESVPDTVILSGCETTRERADVAVASISIAQAFLARGAQAVLATTRPVPDELGLALSRALIADGRFALDPARFRRVQLALRADPSTKQHWASYRLLVP